MEYGGSLSMDGLTSVCSLFSSGSESSKQRVLFQSGLSKHEQCDGLEENEWTRFKMAAESSKQVPCFLRSSCSHTLFPDGEKMLSFSSRKSDAAALNTDRDLQFYYHPSVSSSSSVPPYLRSSEMGPGSSNFDMFGIVAGIRGPFTPSQWVELEHQILICQYIDAKVPIPSSLLIPIRRCLNLSVCPVYSAVSHNRSSSSSVWGTSHLSYSGSSDPEPGRCHRTDGKKWRCSRDAIADQKYCERHLNRVRHRSRKHVEAHNGRATKATIPAVTSTQSAPAASVDNSSNNLTIAQQPRTSFQPSMKKQSPVQVNRLPTNKEIKGGVQNSGGLPMLPDLSPKSGGALLPILKQQNSFEGTPAPADFGLICTDAAVNLQGTSHSESISFAVPNSEINYLSSNSNYLVRFFDDLTNSPSECSTMAWSDVDEMQSDKTQLSISIPMALSDKSSSSSPNHVKHPISPHRHSCDFNTLGDSSQMYPNWVPISWEPSIGGPLGEVVTNKKSSTAEDLSGNLISSSTMNHLLIDGWSLNPMVDSSPTAVLQKASLGSLSSSAGSSSPRAEIEKHERNET